MTDIAVVHTLTTPGGVIVFNSGNADQFYLSAVPGLSGVAARVPVDKIPFGHGGIVHTGWRDVRRFQPEGSLLILSVKAQQDVVTVRNTMEENLRVAYESLLNADGTWQWTPLGLGSRTLTVRRDEQPLEFVHSDSYQIVDFSFGLVCADPDWA